MFEGLSWAVNLVFLLGMGKKGSPTKKEDLCSPAGADQGGMVHAGSLVAPAL